MFLILIDVNDKQGKITQYINAHNTFLDKYYKNNIFIVSGPRIPFDGGLILANVESKLLLETIMKEDPFYENGIANFRIIEFTPSKYQQVLASYIR